MLTWCEVPKQHSAEAMNGEDNAQEEGFQTSLCEVSCKRISLLLCSFVDVVDVVVVAFVVSFTRSIMLPGMHSKIGCAASDARKPVFTVIVGFSSAPIIVTGARNIRHPRGAPCSKRGSGKGVLEKEFWVFCLQHCLLGSSGCEWSWPFFKQSGKNQECGENVSFCSPPRTRHIIPTNGLFRKWPKLSLAATILILVFLGGGFGFWPKWDFQKHTNFAETTKTQCAKMARSKTQFLQWRVRNRPS